MPHYRSIRCITIAWTAMFAWAAGPVAAQQAAPTAAGVLVLRNGNILPGSVQRQGNHFRVENEGSVLQVPASQVEMACESLVQAYEQRRQHRVGNATDAHLELARWCLRHGLLAEAAREILDARTDDPGHPALRTLDLQLQQGLADEANRRQRQQEAVALAAHQQAVQQPVASAAVETPTTFIEPSPEVQQQFVRSIQPMLIHGCTTSGCHTPNSQQAMILDRWALEGSGIPSLIRQNLGQVLAQIDVEDPASSPLMRRARQPHGRRNERLSTPLAPYQTAILIEWLNDAAGIQPEQPPVEQASAPADEISEAMMDEAARELLQGRKARTAFTPRDQFDPEIFNRRRLRTADASSAARAEPEGDEDFELIPDTIELTPTAPASVEE
jgi:hypothetical protein